MKIGIVLGGGFARGSAQMGFLKGMIKHLDRKDISLISCSSIGGINGLCLSMNQIDEAEKIYKTLNFKDLHNLRFNLKNKLVDRVIKDITLSGNEIEIPMYVTGTCLNTLSTHYFYLDKNKSIDEVSKAINITLTFPFVNGLFRNEFGRFYLDGGATDNIPTYPFLMHHVDLLIILHCYPKYLPPAEIVNSDTTVVDIDVSTRCGNNVGTYSFETKNLTKIFDIGEKYGEEFGEKVLKGDKKKKKERCQEFIRDEIPLRKKLKVTITAAVFFNKLQQSRGFKLWAI